MAPKTFTHEVDRDYSTDYNSMLYRLVRLEDNKALITLTSRKRMEEELEERNLTNVTLWR
jgi:hypothetical protein